MTPAPSSPVQLWIGTELHWRISDSSPVQATLFIVKFVGTDPYLDPYK